MGLMSVAVFINLFVALLGMTGQKVTVVSNSAEFRHAVLSAKPGTKILLRPGDFEGGLFFENVKG